MTPHFKETCLKLPLYSYPSATSNIARSRVENVKIEHSSSTGLEKNSVDGKNGGEGEDRSALSRRFAVWDWVAAGGMTGIEHDADV